MKRNLTLERIRKASCPPEKNQHFIWDRDPGCLGVRITQGGAKSFIFEAKLNGKTIRTTIGSCQVWTIEDARIEARRIRRMIDRGIDPRTPKSESKDPEKVSLQALCETYVTHLARRGKVSAKSAGSLLKVHVFEADPELADRPAREIKPREIANLIRRVLDQGKNRAAGVLRSYLSAAYNCGIRAELDASLSRDFVRFGVELNPATSIPALPVKTRNRTLSKEELRKYVNSLGDGMTDKALKVALYSGGQRMSQLLRATVQDWFPDEGILRLYDGKGGRAEPREHLLPLGPLAGGIVQALADEAKKAGRSSLFVVSGRKITLKAAGNRLRQLRNAIDTEPFDLRDIRRTCETLLASLGVSQDLRAQLLSHGLSGVQNRHYDRHDYLSEKKAVLLKWEDFLDQIARGEYNR